MAKSERPRTQFAICIKADENDMLTPRKIYEVLPDDSAAKSGCIRVVDDEGEDYIYPLSNFVFVDLPTEITEVLDHVS